MIFVCPRTGEASNTLRMANTDAIDGQCEK
jgi:hypothetical protein